ncbi:hypothetical protein GQ602_001654 [Ophiocordyceps camponoti-floridani]|uniref:Extracellular membrane protein CFEM domain-containing protein n=1 Tax=Ophiocordyceps camponoti-floridani TaxID=2030778 RepID=A0A8H4VEK4_9HYPO|nr:hypothetical protein GQ602_001654 [Ophiocordyceps camponoti-floridani]
MRAELVVLASLAGPALAVPSFERRQEKPIDKRETYPIDRINGICTNHWDRFIPHQVCVNIHLECWQKPESQYRVQADTCAGTRILRMRLDGTANKGQTKPAAEKPKESKPEEPKPEEPKPVIEKPAEPKPAHEKPEDSDPVADNPINTPESEIQPASELSPEQVIEAACGDQRAGQEGFPTMKFCISIATLCQEGMGLDSVDWVPCLSQTMAEEMQRIDAKEKASKQAKEKEPQGQDKDKDVQTPDKKPEPSSTPQSTPQPSPQESIPGVCKEFFAGRPNYPSMDFCLDAANKCQQQLGSKYDDWVPCVLRSMTDEIRKPRDKAQPPVPTPDDKPEPIETPQPSPQPSPEGSIAAACKELFAGRKGYPSMEFCVAAAKKCQEQLGSRYDDWVPCLVRDLTEEVRNPQSQAQPSVEQTGTTAQETASQSSQQTSAMTTATAQETSTEEPELTSSTSDELKPVQTSVETQATSTNATALAEEAPSTTTAKTTLSDAEESQPTQTTASSTVGSSTVETTSETPKPTPTASAKQQFRDRCNISGRPKACLRAATNCAARFTRDSKLEDFLDCVDSMQLCLNAGSKQGECMEASGQCVSELKGQGQLVDYQVLKKCVMKKRPANFC